MSTLYELTDQYMILQAMAEDDYVDVVALKDTMESIDDEIEDKADAYGKIIKSLEGDMASVDAEIKRLTAKKQAMQSKIDTMKSYLGDSMKKMDKPKIKTALFSFWIQKNPPSIEISVSDDAEIPKELLIQHAPTVDRKAALDYVKKNGDQPWGRMKQTESLRIK